MHFRILQVIINFHDRSSPKIERGLDMPEVVFYPLFASMGPSINHYMSTWGGGGGGGGGR